MNNEIITEKEKLDAFTDIETMLASGYILPEVIEHIAKAYDILPFQLGLWYANYKR